MANYTERLQSPYKISVEINILDENQILKNIPVHSAHLVEADKSLIILANKEKRILTNEPTGFNYSDDYLKTLKYQEIESGISGWVLKNKKSITIPNQLGKIDASIKKDKGFGKSPLIVIPFFVEEEILGTLTVRRKEGRPRFKKEDVKLLRDFAEHAAIAIKNARLNRKDMQRQIAFLHKEDIFKLIYEQTEKLGMKNLSIALYDEEKKAINFVLASENGKLLDIKTSPWLSDPKFKHPKTEQVILKRDYLILTGRKDVKTRGDQIRKSEGPWLGVPMIFREKVGVPMIFREKVIGVIATYDFDKERKYYLYDVEILQAIADKAAVALENINLYDELRSKERNERNKLQTLIDNLPVHIYMKDKNSKFTLVNKTVVDTLGAKNKDEILGKCDKDFHEEDSANEFFADERKVITNGERVENKREYIKDRKTETWRRLLSTKIPYKEKGEIVGLMGINRDITETTELNAVYQIANAAQTSEDLYELYQKIHNTIRGLMKAENFYIALYDDKSQTVSLPYFIDECAQKYELQKTYRNFDLTGAKNIEKKIQEIIIKIIGEEPTSSVGVPLVAGDKTIGFLSVQSYTEDFEYGPADTEMLNYVSTQIATAIERKMATERLEKLNRRQKMLIDLGQELTSDIGLSDDEIIKIIYVNANLLMDTRNMSIAMYDKTQNKVKCKLAYKNGILRDSTEWKADVGKAAEVIKKKKPLFLRTKQELEKWNNDHDLKYEGQGATWLGVPMKFGDKVLGVIATYHPTDESIYNEDDFEILQALSNEGAIALQNSFLYYDAVQELEKANQKLKKLEKTKSNFVRIVSHEFRRNITIINSTVQNMVQEKSGKINEKQKDKLEKILKTIDREMWLIKNYLDIFQIEEGKIKTIKRFESINELIDDVSKEMKRLAKIKNIQFNKNLLDEDIFIEIDKNMIRSVLLNLVWNAIRYTKSGGSITVAAYEDREYVVVYVEDTGVGIKKGEIKKIFKPYQRGNNTRDTIGTGIGLHIVKTFVEYHDGEIWVESKPNNGSKFSFKIPKRGLK